MQGIGIEYNTASSIFQEAVWKISGDTMIRVRHIDRGPIQIGRVDSVRTSGSTIGVQMGPNQTVTNSNGVTGAEIRARSNACGTGALLGVNASINATSATNATGPVKGFEANITVAGTRTTTEVNALRAFLDVASTVTVTNGKHVINVAAPNISQWDSVLNIEAGNTALVTATAGASASLNLRIKYGATYYKIALLADA